jgi:hypothetical protein
MQIIEFIFHFGVIIAVFTFLWWFFGLLLSLLFAPFGLTPRRTYYAQKTLKYFFLVTVAFRFALDDRFGLQGSRDITGYVISALILLAYLVGKAEAKNNRIKFYTNIGNLRQFELTPFDRNKELLLIGLSILFYGYFVLFPQGAHNVITDWFVDSIVSISDTPVFGWIFKIIGFFFLIMVLMRFVNGLFALIGMPNERRGVIKRKNEDQDFDDYEEIK